jgi:zinc protease
MTVYRFSPLKHVQSHHLPSGLRVLLKEDHSWPLVSVQAWIRVGSVDEAESEAGLAHVLEHMVFKGTAHHKASEISRWAENRGGSLNAETSKEYTHYYLDLPSGGTRQAIHLLAELLCRATLDPADWHRECPVILQEMRRRHDDAETLAWELLQKALFSDPAHARPVIGTPETVSSFSASTVRRFYGGHYAAGHTLLVLAGDFKSSEVLRWIRDEFGSMPKGLQPSGRPQTLLQEEAIHQKIQKEVRQSYVIYGWVTPTATHPDQEALDLLAVILGEGRNARLVDWLRERKRLVWSIGASNMTQEGPGIFAISAECDIQKRSRVGPAMQEVLKKLRNRPPRAEEIRRAKALIQTAWLQGYETFHNQAATLGAYGLEDHLDRLARYLPRILSLQRQEILEVADRTFSRNLSSAVVEP